MGSGVGRGVGSGVGFGVGFGVGSGVGSGVGVTSGAITKASGISGNGPPLQFLSLYAIVFQVLAPVPVGVTRTPKRACSCLVPPTSRPFSDWNLTRTLEPEPPLIDAFQL